ncbi:MAG: DNA polymerase III subunit gamma/tau [Candidatus Nealsonbacteria bacterium CG07_land_8_20_14_0_80_40_10]|nr:MAG: DNA polymerase III subunit gamma/tau [Candidatus Nealsonbacteria bacterium CG07_land_8_20_14_0_80_40_10]
MSLSLYRKYRPQKFKDVHSQDHIKKVLVSALESGRISHAYLFAGPKGTGKTTVARILAKAFNCQKGKAEPCNKCQSCVEIISGKSLDLIEIDAASNRGIDEVRELREKVKFAPSLGKYKVIIIDECHMLTREAFNALLKTLEEPPAHVIFILATTEAHKVPATILSRCQQFDFKRAKIKEIVQLLSKIAKEEDFKISSEGLNLIASLSDGAFRDAISILDQIKSLNLTQNKEISVKEIRAALGLGKWESVYQLIGYIFQSKQDKSFDLIEELFVQGIDFLNFNQMVVSALRRILLLKMGAQTNFEQEDENLTEIVKKAQAIAPDKILALANLFLESQSQIKTSFILQLPLELAIAKSQLLLGQDILEVTANKETSNISDAAADRKTPYQKATEQNINPVLWEKILNGIKPHNHSLFALLKDAKPVIIEENKLVLAAQFKFHKEKILQHQNRVIIEQTLSQVLGRDLLIDCILLDKEKIKQEEEDMLLSAKDLFGVEEQDE